MYFRFPLLMLIIVGGLTALFFFMSKLDNSAATLEEEQLGSSIVTNVETSENIFSDEIILDSIRSQDLRAHLEFLADDLLEGREAASRGARLAALYIAKQFRAYGLKEVGEDGTFFQPVKLYLEQISADSEVRVEIDGEMVPFNYGQDFVVAVAPAKKQVDLTRDVVFTGFGIQAEEYNYNDFEAVDVTGKATIYLTGEPGSDDEDFFAGSQTTPYGRGGSKRTTAKKLGADLVIGIVRPDFLDQIGWSGVRNFYEGEKISLMPSVNKDDFVALIVHPDAAELLFAGAEQTFEQIDKSAAEGYSNSFALDKKVQVSVRNDQEIIFDNNVVGFLEGSDPDLKSEIVIFTAHYDHEGIGQPVKGDSIYNGAADNASGVAGLLELAEAFSLLPNPPRRSLLFLAVTAEEKGLLGSEYYVNNPVFPLSKTVANFNLDMIGIGDTTGIVAYGIERSSLGKELENASAQIGLKILPDELPEQRIFYRSDHYNFAKKGVPAIMPSFGINRDWFSEFTTFYHRPSDDSHLAFLNYSYMSKTVRVIFLAGLRVANAAEKPKWTPGDEFENIQ